MTTPTKMQKAGRTFLLRLVAENGEEAAEALRRLGDELEGLAAAEGDLAHQVQLRAIPC
jgi:hypothetical protein